MTGTLWRCQDKIDLSHFSLKLQRVSISDILHEKSDIREIVHKSIAGYRADVNSCDYLYPRLLRSATTPTTSGKQIQSSQLLAPIHVHLYGPLALCSDVHGGAKHCLIENSLWGHGLHVILVPLTLSDK